MPSFEQSRTKEMSYHHHFYEEHELFQPGSWLSKPAPGVIDQLEYVSEDAPQVLDLGCGVGRNAIPIAQYIKNGGGHITGVDLLPVAIEKLKEGKRNPSMK